jgi:hypothetical protein
MNIMLDTVHPLELYQTCHLRKWICFHHQVQGKNFLLSKKASLDDWNHLAQNNCHVYHNMNPHYHKNLKSYTGSTYVLHFTQVTLVRFFRKGLHLKSSLNTTKLHCMYPGNNESSTNKKLKAQNHMAVV